MVLAQVLMVEIIFSDAEMAEAAEVRGPLVVQAVRVAAEVCLEAEVVLAEVLTAPKLLGVQAHATKSVCGRIR